MAADISVDNFAYSPNDKNRILFADASFVDKIGIMHSQAWKETYRNIFPRNYLNQDSEEKRKQEFLMSIEDPKITYYLTFKNENLVGLTKLNITYKNECEIESLYFLEKYRGMGYGTEALDFIKKQYFNYKICLWVLKINCQAIKFYEKNGFKFNGEERIINRGNDYIQFQYEYTNVIVNDIRNAN